MRRFKQQISEEECIRILEEQPRGVLSMIGDEGWMRRHAKVPIEYLQIYRPNIYKYTDSIFTKVPIRYMMTTR